MPTPGKAKRYGQKISPLQVTWDWHKANIMRDLLTLKFADPVLRQKLIDTDPKELEETNSWGDTFWGVCNGVGQNVLGVQLMSVRHTLMNPKIENFVTDTGRLKGTPVDFIIFDDIQNITSEDSKTVDAA